MALRIQIICRSFALSILDFYVSSMNLSYVWIFRNHMWHVTCRKTTCHMYTIAYFPNNISTKIILAESTTLMADGTFFPTKNSNYEQLWILSIVHKPLNNVRSFLQPIYFVYMKNRTSAAYELVLKHFQNISGNKLRCTVSLSNSGFLI